MDESCYCCICGVSENVCENDHICKSCCEFAVQRFKKSKPSVTPKMEVVEDNNKQPINCGCSKNEASNVCLLCGMSLSTRQSLYIIENDPTELDHLMLNFISEALPPQTKISKKDKLCSKCWFKVRRSAIDLQQMNDLESHEIEDSNRFISEIKSEPENGEEHSEHWMQHPNEVEIASEQGDVTNGDCSPIYNNEDLPNGDCSLIHDNEDLTSSDHLPIHDIEDDPSDPDFTVRLPSDDRIQKKEDNRAKASTGILLPNYKRCRQLTNNSCMFQNCKNTRKFRCVNSNIREKLFLDCRFYIPPPVRVCPEHLQTENWHDSNECINRMRECKPLKFLTKHIEDMFSMVQIKKSTDLDFNNILYFDDNLLQHLFGIKKETLTILLKNVPEINNSSGYFNGLLGLLLKHENGGCNERIARLLKTARRTLECGMKNVKKIISKTQVTKELGLEHLLHVKLTKPNIKKR